MTALQGNLLKMLGVEAGGWRPWREVSLLSALLMDVSWAAPWLHALVQGANTASAATFAGVMAGLAITTYLIIRLSAAFNLGRSIRFIAMALPLLIVLPLSLGVALYPQELLGYREILGRFSQAMANSPSLIPDEFLAAMGFAYIWMRATRWASADGSASEILRRFKSVFVLLIVFVFIFVWRGQAELGGFVYLFFFLAWLAMGSARLARSETQSTSGPFFTPGWLLTMIGGLGAFSLLLILLGWGIQAQFGLVQRAALSLWLLFWGIVILIFSPLIVAIGWIFEWIVARIDPATWESLQGAGQAFSSVGENLSDFVQNLSQGSNNSFLQGLLDWLNSMNLAAVLLALRPVAFWGVLLVLLVTGLYYAGRRIGFWSALRNMRVAETATVQSEHWWRKMSADWRSRLEDFRQSLAQLIDPQRGRRLLAAARIRRVYAYLMDLSEILGQPRQQAQTPLEFKPTLLKLFPFHADEVEVISGAYMRVRYGELDETPNDVIDVDKAWLKVKLEGEHMRKKRKKEAAKSKAA